jgi:superfamily II DNA or RNA helicase
MRLRDYQRHALEGAREQLRKGAKRVLVVLPTGCGKTVVFSEAIRLACAKGGKALVLAHRTELLDQARKKLRAVAPDLRVELEQAASRASTKADVVVASVQTLKGARLEAWPRDAFQLLIIDEAHHATAKSYRTIRDHFESARVLGVTATPDRADERALGDVFDAVGFEYSMQAAIAQGYLVPLKLRTVRVDALDLRHVKVRGGDFVEADLVAALEGDEVLLEIAGPLPRLAGDRPTIVFIAGVANAHRLAELLNTRTGRPGCAVALDGTTQDGLRAHHLARFERGDFQFLVNVGLFTEGFDSPRIGCVAVARPTQSRGLYCQMLGRGTRPLTGTIDACEDGAQRVAAIASSAKPDLLVVDFTSSTSKHRLVTPVDVLGVTDPDVRARAAELLEENPELDVSEAAARAEEDAQLRLVKRLSHTYELTVETWDPFRLIQGDLEFAGALELDLAVYAGDAPKGIDPVELRAELEERGVPKKVARDLTIGQGLAVLRALQKRAARGLCSLKQAQQLQRFGLNPNVSRELAGRAMQLLGLTGWTHAPRELLNDPRYRASRPEDSAA